MLKRDSIAFTSFVKIWPVLCLVALTIFTFRLYRSFYFSLDDFNNLSLIQTPSGMQVLRSLLDPAVQGFRPGGLAFYWALYRCCDLDPTAYHATAWLLHSLNITLVFVLLRRMVGSDYGAAVGAVLFAFEAIFHDVYWSFGMIFELASTFLFLMALLIHTRFRPSILRGAAVAIAFFLAYKTKEMAITLPIILILHDLLQPAAAKHSVDKRLAWKSLPSVAIPLFAAAWFLWQRSADIAGLSLQPDHPYHMDLSPGAIAQSYNWYINVLFGASFSWEQTISVTALLFGLFAWRKNRSGIFFLTYAVISLTPVIPLVEHRSGFYWYLPFFGICGFAGLAAAFIGDWFKARMARKTAAVCGIIAFGLFCRRHYFVQKDLSAALRVWNVAPSMEYRTFIDGIRALPSPPAGETLYFASLPTRFDEGLATAAIRVALSRTDLHAKLVDVFPENSGYRLQFDGGQLKMIAR